MAVRTDFVAGEVLAAQDLDDTFASKVNYALPINPQTGSGASAYTFALADGLRLTTASNAAASTYTIPPQASVAWLANSVIRIVNYGAGVVTIAGGAGVTVTNATTTLAQFESAALIRTASNAWTLVPFSGAGNANFSNTATGTYTDGGIAYKYITFTGSGTLTVTKAGLADVLVVGGGGGGQSVISGGVGGGGAGGYLETNTYLPAGSLTVTVGAGGGSNSNGNVSRILSLFAIHGQGGGGTDSRILAASGGGAVEGSTARPGISGQGNSGGNGETPISNGTGGGGGGANAAGGNAVGNAAGNGGNGEASSITGSSVTRAGGGGGSANADGATGGDGGSGGGGVGRRGTARAATSAGANTGGGGGGAGGNNTPGNGGSGVVIIRVRT